jgi:hypothetical protein
MKLYWGSGCTGPRILDLGTRWRWWAASRADRFNPREKAPGTHWIGGWVYPRAGGEEKNSQPLPEFEPPIIQPVAQRYTIELFRFL